MLNDFYDAQSRPIVTLEAFYGPKKHLLDKCLVTFSKAIFDHISECFACKQVAVFSACNGDHPILSFTHNGEEIAFYLSPLGSALAGDAVAEANHLTGATKFIMFGSCGSLDGEKTCGKFILPTEAYRGEGMSHYFAEASDYIRVRNSDRLASVFSDLRIPHVQGRVWTTDCMLRETVDLVKRRKTEGCIAVDMEIAGVQAVCDFYGWELYDFLSSGDVLLENSYDTQALDDANHNFDKFCVALQIAERI